MIQKAILLLIQSFTKKFHSLCRNLLVIMNSTCPNWMSSLQFINSFCVTQFLQYMVPLVEISFLIQALNNWKSYKTFKGAFILQNIQRSFAPCYKLYLDV